MKKVLIVDSNSTIQEILINFYFSSIVEPRFQKKYQTIKANSIAEAKRKIGDSPKSIEIMIFAQGMPETEIDDLTDWIEAKSLSIPFVFADTKKIQMSALSFKGQLPKNRA